MENIINKIRKFNQDRDWDQFHKPDNMAKSIAIESAELLECFQWNSEEYDLNSVCEELADVFIYCLQMADVLGVDIKEIANDKIKKNEKKYPVEKAKGTSKKYNEL